MRVLALTAAALIAATATANAAYQDFDRNDDTMISAEEFLDVFGPDRGIEQFYIIDKNNDMQIDLAEFQAQTNDAGLLSEY